MPVVIIDGEQYIKATEVQELAQKLLLDTLKRVQVEPPEAPPEPTQNVPVATVQEAPAQVPLIDRISRIVRLTSVPTAALLQQKVNSVTYDEEAGVCTIAMARPFVEQFARNPVKTEIVRDAVRCVLGGDVATEIVVREEQPPVMPVIQFEAKSDAALYDAWRKLHLQAMNGIRKSYTHKDLCALSGLTKSSGYHSFRRLVDRSMINDKYLKARKVKK